MPGLLSPRSLEDVLHGSNLTPTFWLIDALDKCTTDLDKLLELIVSKLAALTSNGLCLAGIEEYLELAGQKTLLSLELNAESVSAAVEIYV